MWVDEQQRVHQIAAVVALVAARPRIVADVALALDVAIWQKTFFNFAVEKLLLLFVEMPPFQQ
jgi:hypothetical protein